MSHLTPDSNPNSPCVEDPCTGIELIIPPRQRDLGGFSVRRILPIMKRRYVGPWVFFDHMGPAEFEVGDGIDVLPHPHVCLATVTYLFEGEILHRDSLGTEQAIRPGDINLMVAGKGIVHSERETSETRQQPHQLHGLQLWLALPEAEEEIDPAFYHYPAAEIPKLSINGIPVRVMIGSAWGLTSPVKTFSETLYAEAELQPGQYLALPDTEEVAVYVAHGTITARDSEIATYHMAVFNQPEGVLISATEPNTRIAIIGGKPLGQRYMFWNFVSSRKERIEEAKADWEAQRFPIIPGDSDEHIPLPEA